jgi:hypothetical protein
VIDPNQQSVDTTPLLECFPRYAALLTRLLAEDDAFRTLCEDFMLAKTTLFQLEAFERTTVVAKIAEYRQIVHDLEQEIAEVLQNAERPH